MASTLSPKTAPGLKTKSPAPVKEVKITPSKVNTAEWIAVVVSLLCLDILQYVFIPFVFVNRIGDILIVGGLLIYLYMRGELAYPPTRKRIFIVIAATFVAEALFVGDVAPFWFFDGIYFFYLSRQRNQASETQKIRLANVTKQLTAYEIRMKVMVIQQRQAMKEQQEQQEEEMQMQEEESVQK